MAFTRNNLQRKRSSQRGLMYHVHSLHWQWPGIHTTWVDAHSGFFRGHKTRARDCCCEVSMAAENIAMGWKADKKGLVLVFTSIRWLRLKGVPLSSLLLSKQAHLWCRNNQLLTGKTRLCFRFTPSERNDSQDAALGALPQPKTWARVGVPCSAGSSWTSRRSSAEPSGGYTKWQPLCWHGYRKGSSLGCCHPLQSTRKWWTSGFSRAVQPQPVSHRLCKLTVTAELTLPLWRASLEHCTLITLLRAWPLPSWALTLSGTVSLIATKTPFATQERGSTSVVRAEDSRIILLKTLSGFTYPTCPLCKVVKSTS